jgi:ankyrin repeat protein
MIAMPKLIPSDIWSALSLAIASGDTPQVQQIIEQHNLDVNAFVDSRSWMPILMEALLSYGFDTEEDRLVLLRYLLDRGANPNIVCLRGYNCLHIAVQQEKYLKALDLFLDYHADVNIGDEDGSTVVYWAIQGWLLRKGGDDRAAHLRVLGKILRLGANLDQQNRYGMNARKWLEAAAQDVTELVTRCEQARYPVSASTTVQPVFPTGLRYPEIAQQIWTELVPRSGPADTLQGELLRAVERLREEAQLHHNRNYKRAHKRLAIMVRNTLISSGLFDQAETDRIRSNTQRLMRSSHPYTANDIYDHLVDQVCIYYMQKPPIPLRTPDVSKPYRIAHAEPITS